MSSDDEKYKAIRNALIMLCNSHSKKPTKQLFAAWILAIDFLTPEQIGEATIYCLRKRKDKYMPSTGQFIEISEQLEAEKAKQQRVTEEIEENNKYITHNPVGVEKVAELASDIAKSMQSDKTKVHEPPELTIYEYLSATGRVKSYQAVGRHESDFFREQVFKTFGVRPNRIQHKSKIFEAVKPNEPKDSRFYHTYRECSDYVPGSEIFTIGYV